MRPADEHPFFEGMSGRWRAYISTLREFEQKCYDLDKCDLVNECFTTNLAQTSADKLDTLFIRQLLVYYRSRMLVLAHEARHANDDGHVCILLSRNSLYASQFDILTRELVSRRERFKCSRIHVAF